MPVITGTRNGSATRAPAMTAITAKASTAISIAVSFGASSGASEEAGETVPRVLRLAAWSRFTLTTALIWLRLVRGLFDRLAAGAHVLARAFDGIAPCDHHHHNSEKVCGCL